MRKLLHDGPNVAWKDPLFDKNLGVFNQLAQQISATNLRQTAESLYRNSADLLLRSPRVTPMQRQALYDAFTKAAASIKSTLEGLEIQLADAALILQMSERLQRRGEELFTTPSAE